VTVNDDTATLDIALALLTLLTGEDWDRERLLKDSNQLRELAALALVRKGLSRADADTFVAERWAKYAAENPVPAQAVAEKPIHAVDAGVSIGSVTPEIPSVNDMRERMAARRAKLTS